MPDSTDAVWLLWELMYDEARHDYTRVLIGVYGSREGADAAQVSRNITEFELDRQEIR